MKRIYIVMLFAALATITYAQTDDIRLSGGSLGIERSDWS